MLTKTLFSGLISLCLTFTASIGAQSDGLSSLKALFSETDPSVLIAYGLIPPMKYVRKSLAEENGIIPLTPHHIDQELKTIQRNSHTFKIKQLYKYSTNLSRILMEGEFLLRDYYGIENQERTYLNALFWQHLYLIKAMIDSPCLAATAQEQHLPDIMNYAREAISNFINYDQDCLLNQKLSARAEIYVLVNLLDPLNSWPFLPHQIKYPAVIRHSLPLFNLTEADPNNQPPQP